MFPAARVLQDDFADLSLPELLRLVSANWTVDEDAWLDQLLPLADPGPVLAPAIRKTTLDLIAAVRKRPDAADALDALLREYSLDTREGLMLMCLAEALLRIPDAATADALIRDRLDSADWDRHLGHSDNLLVNLASWGLALTGRLVKLDHRALLGGTAPADAPPRPGQLLERLVGRAGEPAIRAALQQAMKFMGRQFVLGRDIDEALANARPWRERGCTCSFDMLGEAALTADDAGRYLDDYRRAIRAVGAAPAVGGGPRPSVSIKLSALHPRYEESQRERVLTELLARLRDLAREARALDVPLSIDAEEADRLELSLALFEPLLRDPALAGWGGLGMVVQAYSRRALPVLVWLTRLARETATPVPVRLVKGAYWDSEIKAAQVGGHDGYPVFTRKAGTDVSYLACARYLLSERTRGLPSGGAGGKPPGRDLLLPQFATHNAQTVAAILAMAGEREFEFQRLHGMGEALHDEVLARGGRPVRIYAPVGAHRDLLPYLVRRLLENGANSSFVHRLADPAVAAETLAEHPVTTLRRHASAHDPRLPPPRDLFGERRNSRGVDLNIAAQREAFEAALAPWWGREWRAGIITADHSGRVADPTAASGTDRAVVCPWSPSRIVGRVRDASADDVRPAIDGLAAFFPRWDATPVDDRAAVLDRLADRLERERAELVALCTLEAGKTLRDGIDEVREAVDFCRYYAVQARNRLVRTVLPGPTGERNELFHAGRGVFACISPWNFPVSIFIGQITAALVAGNTVLAKPAEQTSLVAARIAQLLLDAGLPPQAFAMLPGDGATLGAAICADPRVAGVCFTGSTDTARAINRALAARDGPIATLIAETGGQNAMLVDSTALPEQVVRDVIASAFTSAGQRCSALRVLCLQDDIADRVLTMLRGAMAELVVGRPDRLATDVGPVIDADARDALLAHIATLRKEARLVAETLLPAALARPDRHNTPVTPDTHDASDSLDGLGSLDGHFIAPIAFEIDGLHRLDREHFGPVLHVVRHAASELEAVIGAINGSGYGLTLGVHSRNEQTIRRVEALARVGNLYANRNQVGAVVGVQPFGGCGLSGTGPKAGGPAYLARFTTERTTTVNTAAIGGNASLLMQSEH